MAPDLAELRCSGIYGIFCLADNKVYVGQSVDISRRRRAHYRLLREGRHFNLHLQAAFSKYGEEFFEFRVIERCQVEVLNQREISWVSYYGSSDRARGFNIEPGGDAHGVFSEETRKRMSLAKLGRRLSVETRSKLSAAHRGKPRSQEAILKQRATMLMRPLSEDALAKMSAAAAGRKHSPEAIRRMKVSQAEARRKYGPYPPLSAEARKKISDAKRGRKHSPEAIERMRQAHRRRKAAL